jgi:glycosyltransferase involved in cell wall biosynthesis
LQTLFIGLAAQEGLYGTVDVCIASHDGTYSTDFAVEVLGGKINDLDVNGQTTTSAELRVPSSISTGYQTPSGVRTPLPPAERPAALADYFVEAIKKYEEEHYYKVVGAGITRTAAKMSPQLSSRLWWELDIVPMIFEQGIEFPNETALDVAPAVDEAADSVARKCLMFFGPTMQPRLQVGFRNRVEVDSGGHAQITCIEQYPATVGKNTWDATLHYVDSLKKNKTKIAFFNTTPQGGGVALMRHALVRFLRVMGVSCSWYVPKPKPEVFRTTKNNHNILQGVSDPDLRTTKEQFHLLDDWCTHNAERFWLPQGGPLSPRSKGGADLIVVDDPQMPSLVEIAKRADPDRPVIFRSHIQVRSDLADKAGTPANDVWNWVWNHIKQCDVFVSHPVREFVPASVNFNRVGYAPAATDWLDGLNKSLNDYDRRYYFHEFRTECSKTCMNSLEFPRRDYIAQIARFDPSKGIPDVLDAYARLRRDHMGDTDREATPQLVIAGHGAVDDPDASLVYDQTINLLETRYSDVCEDVVVMRLGPTDQLLNVLLSNAKVALQLSVREGFEVKVSEALHKGVPVVATRSGGIPLQVAHGKNGYLVESGDNAEVARYLNHLFTDKKAYKEMSDYAAAHVSDEVGTVGNALVWLYLADTLTKGEKVEPDSRWINDMARERAGFPYAETETKLTRMSKKLDLKDRSG